MNICMIASNPNKRDGIAKYSYILTEDLRKKHQVFFLCPKEKSTRVYSRIDELFPDNLFKIYRTIRFLLRKEVELVHLQYAIPTYGTSVVSLFFFLLSIRICTKIKVVTTLHEVSRELQLLGWLAKFAFIALSLLSDKLIVHTSQAKQLLLRKCKISADKVVQIPHFIYPDKTKKNQTTIANKHFVLTYFGFIHVDKGLDILIDALSLIRHDQPKFFDSTRLLIAGDVRPRKGLFKLFEKKDLDYKEKIKKLISFHNLDRYIDLQGFVPEERVLQTLRQSSAFVLPYTNAEQSSVLNQLLPIGKPIIASDIGGLGETLREAGILSQPGNAQDLAEKILFVWNNPSEHKSFAQKYRSIADPLSLEKVSASVVELYQSVLVNQNE